MADLFDLAPIFHATRQALQQYLARSSGPLAQHAGEMGATFSHLDDAREGFQLALRVSDVSSLAELHALVRHSLLDWRWLEQVGLSLIPGDEVELVRTQLLAFAHAYTALAFLPRLPAPQITYPGRATYADIAVPRSAGETLERLEELETVLLRATVHPRPAQEPEPLRRTYGYFEVSAWLVTDYGRRTGR